jgi:hypothetical protein
MSKRKKSVRVVDTSTSAIKNNEMVIETRKEYSRYYRRFAEFIEQCGRTDLLDTNADRNNVETLIKLPFQDVGVFNEYLGVVSKNKKNNAMLSWKTPEQFWNALKYFHKLKRIPVAVELEEGLNQLGLFHYLHFVLFAEQVSVFIVVGLQFNVEFHSIRKGNNRTLSLAIQVGQQEDPRNDKVRNVIGCCTNMTLWQFVHL